MIFPGEALHGYMEYGSTSFPQALGLAATWDPSLVKRVFTAVGDEAGSRGAGQVFSPVLDIAREPRWGRTEETYGEDPYLDKSNGRCGNRGTAGRFVHDRPAPRYGDGKALCGAWCPEGGTNTAPGNISERVIRENYLVPIPSRSAGSAMPAA